MGYIKRESLKAERGGRQKKVHGEREKTGTGEGGRQTRLRLSFLIS